MTDELTLVLLERLEATAPEHEDFGFMGAHKRNRYALNHLKHEYPLACVRCALGKAIGDLKAKMLSRETEAI